MCEPACSQIFCILNLPNEWTSLSSDLFLFPISLMSEPAYPQICFYVIPNLPNEWNSLFSDLFSFLISLMRE